MNRRTAQKYGLRIEGLKEPPRSVGFITPAWLTAETIRALEERLVLAKLVGRQYSYKSYKRNQ